MMKKKYCLFALAFLGLTLTACGKTDGVGLKYDDTDLDIDTPWVDYSVPVTKVNFKDGEESIEINKGESHEYDYSLEPAKAKKNSLSWSSSNERVATVDKGIVTGVAPGDTEVTVYNDIESFEPVTLNVKVNSPLNDISFSSQSLAADYEHTYNLADDLLVYSPSDTTQKELSWSVDCANSIAEIDASTGALTTKSTASTITVTARSAYINKAITLTVEIADRTIYPTSVVVDEYLSQIEIAHNFQFSAHAVASDPAQAVTHPEMKYYSDNTGILIVEEDTGVVHAVGEGNAHIYAVASNGVESDHLPVNVFEVKVNAINLDNITLSNRNGRSDVPVDFTYTTDTAGYDVASMPNFVYSTGDENIATVNSNGRLFAVENGVTTLTVLETRSNVSKTVNLTVCYEVDTVSISAPSTTILVNNTTQLSVKTTPGGIPASYISYSSSDESVATVSESGLVRALKQGSVEITATVLGQSAKIALTVDIPDIPFDANYSYVVGSKNYSSGVSQASATGSWDKANQAKCLDRVSQSAHDNLLYERMAIVYFEEGDIWKLRSANGAFGSPYGYLEPNGFPEGATYKLGEYKADGSLSNNDMFVNDENNVVVNRTGWYAIYHAQYMNENPLGWYSIYVGRYELTLSDTTPQVQVGNYVDLVANNWAGELSYQVTQGSNLITVTRGEEPGHIHEFRITAGESEGTAVIVFTDEFKSVEVVVTITKEAPQPATWENGIPYIVGNADYHTGSATGEGSYWGDYPSKAFKASASSETPPAGVYAQFIAEVTFEAGNEFKVVIGGETLYWDLAYQTTEGAFVTDPAQMSKPDNVVVNIAGTYKIYIKCLENDGGWTVYIEPKEGGTPEPIYEHEYYLIGVGGNEQIDNAPYFTKDTDTHYYIENVNLAVGDEIKANNPTTGEWFGVSEAYQEYWEVSQTNNNLKVIVAGSYTVSLYLDATNGNYLRLDPTIPADPIIAEYTAKISIDPALATWTPAVSEVSLYVWTNDGSEPLGKWAECKGNLDSGSVTLTYNKEVTNFILYFTQSGGTLQTVNSKCVLNASGDYIIDISALDWDEQGKMTGVTIHADEGGGDTPVDPGEFDLTNTTVVTVIDETGCGFTKYGCDIKLHMFDITFAEGSPITSVAGLQSEDITFGAETAYNTTAGVIDVTMTWVQNDPVKYTVTIPAYIESCKICVYNSENNWVHEVDLTSPGYPIGEESYQFTTSTENKYDLYLFNNGDPSSYNAWIDNGRMNSPLSLVVTPKN